MLEWHMKKKEKICSSRVKVLLFDKVLSKIYNDKHNIQPITAFYSPCKPSVITENHPGR